MEISKEQILTHLKKEPKQSPFILIHGEENYFKRLVKEFYQKKLFGGPNNDSINYLQEGFSYEQLEELVVSYPFFSGSTLIIIDSTKIFQAEKSVEENETAQNKKKSKVKVKTLNMTDKIIRLLDNLPEHIYIVWQAQKVDKRSRLYKAINKNHLVVESSLYKSYQATPFLMEEAKARGVSWGKEALDLLLFYLSGSEFIYLELLEKEFDKLTLYIGDRRVWEKQDIEIIFADLPNVSVWSMLEAISEKNTGYALELLKNVFAAGNDIMLLTALLSSHIKKIWRTKILLAENHSLASIATELKIPPSITKKIINQSKTFSLEILKETLFALADLNLRIRTGQGEVRDFETIILRLGK